MFLSVVGSNLSGQNHNSQNHIDRLKCLTTQMKVVKLQLVGAICLGSSLYTACTCCPVLLFQLEFDSMNCGPGQHVGPAGCRD